MIIYYCDFFTPLAKAKLKIFASLNRPHKPVKKNKSLSLDIDRELFSKLIVIAQNRAVDIKAVMTYELTPVPITLFSRDGSMWETVNSEALHWMEQDCAISSCRSCFITACSQFPDAASHGVHWNKWLCHIWTVSTVFIWTYVSKQAWLHVICQWQIMQQAFH